MGQSTGFKKSLCGSRCFAVVKGLEPMQVLVLWLRPDSPGLPERRCF